MLEPSRPVDDSLPNVVHAGRVDPGRANEETHQREVPDSPGQSKRRWSKKRIAVVVVLAVLFGGPLVSLAILEATGQSGGISTMAFGTGGSQCSFDTEGRSFTLAEPIRVAAQYSPPLPAGSTVKITVWQDGRVRSDLSGTITLDVESNCLSGPIAPSAPGHYRLEMAPINEPPITGDFDVTP